MYAYTEKSRARGDGGVRNWVFSRSFDRQGSFISSCKERWRRRWSLLASPRLYIHYLNCAGVKGCNSSEKGVLGQKRALWCVCVLVPDPPRRRKPLSPLSCIIWLKAAFIPTDARVLFFSADRTRTNFTRPSCPPQKLRWIGQKAAGQLFRAGQIMRRGRFNKAVPCAAKASL